MKGECPLMAATPKESTRTLRPSLVAAGSASFDGGYMEKTVMTVTGPIPLSKLGVTLMHEHFAFAFPGWWADESLAPYDRAAVEATCLKVLKDAKDLGYDTIVDATPADVGSRDPELFKNLSIKSGMNIIASTGIFTENGGASGYYKWQSCPLGGRNLEEDLYEMFTQELTVGIGKSGVRPGIIKVATGDPAITPYEETVIKAAVRVALEKDVPIITHCDGSTVGPAQQDLFLKFGMNPARVMIGHQNNSLDIGYGLGQLKKPGFYLGFDRMNPDMTDQAEDNAVSLITQGYGDRIMLSHDCIMVWLGRPGNPPPHFADWNPKFMHKKIFPKMKAAGITEEQIRSILADNPRRFFGG
jgi:phosphotriesterase-related protein